MAGTPWKRHITVRLLRRGVGSGRREPALVVRRAIPIGRDVASVGEPSHAERAEWTELGSVGTHRAATGLRWRHGDHPRVSVHRASGDGPSGRGFGPPDEPRSAKHDGNAAAIRDWLRCGALRAGAEPILEPGAQRGGCALAGVSCGYVCAAARGTDQSLGRPAVDDDPDGSRHRRGVPDWSAPGAGPGEHFPGHPVVLRSVH